MTVQLTVTSLIRSAVPFPAAFQPPGPDPDETRRRLARILERREFRRSGPNVFQRILEWLLDHLPGPSSGSISGGFGSVLGWCIVALAVGVAVWVAVIAVRHRITARKAVDDEVELSEEEDRTAGSWADEAARCEAQGDWRGALRCRYREVVTRLVDRGVLPSVPGRTPHELSDDLRRSAPAAGEPFAELSEFFGLVFYADRPTGAEPHRRVVDLCDRVLAAARHAVPPADGPNSGNPDGPDSGNPDVSTDPDSVDHMVLVDGGAGR